MRNRPPFECPQCGVRSPVGVKCEGCRIAMVDQDGAASLSRPVRFFPASSPAHVASTLGLSIRAWRGRRLRAATPRSTVGDAADGTCRIAGRVPLLRSVPDPEGHAVGAVRIRRRHVVKIAIRSDTADVDSVSYEDTEACGRFAVLDGTGVAIVDDDCFDLWPWDGDAQPSGVRVHDGLEVEVVGPARWGEAADVRDLVVRTGYREVGKALIFDGRPDAPVRIFAAGPGDDQSRSIVRPS